MNDADGGFKVEVDGLRVTTAGLAVAGFPELIRRARSQVELEKARRLLGIAGYMVSTSSRFRAGETLQLQDGREVTFVAAGGDYLEVMIDGI